MICVIYLHNPGGPPDTPVWLDTETRAVPAAPYAAIDQGHGGVTRADLRDDDIRPLRTFEPGDEVFVESTDPEDVLDDADAQQENATRIYWRAMIVPVPVPVPGDGRP
jgi:hypothetical protein